MPKPSGFRPSARTDVVGSAASSMAPAPSKKWVVTRMIASLEPGAAKTVAIRSTRNRLGWRDAWLDTGAPCGQRAPARDTRCLVRYSGCRSALAAGPHFALVSGDLGKMPCQFDTVVG